MYGIPRDLDLSLALGQFITGYFVGAWDLQFQLGPIKFIVQSTLSLCHGDREIARWESGQWPPSRLRELFNEELAAFAVTSRECLELTFRNGLLLRLRDDSLKYESMQIVFGNGAVVVV